MLAPSCMTARGAVAAVRAPGALARQQARQHCWQLRKAPSPAARHGPQTQGEWASEGLIAGAHQCCPPGVHTGAARHAGPAATPAGASVLLWGSEGCAGVLHLLLCSGRPPALPAVAQRASPPAPCCTLHRPRPLQPPCTAARGARRGTGRRAAAVAGPGERPARPPASAVPVRWLALERE